MTVTYRIGSDEVAESLRWVGDGVVGVDAADRVDQHPDVPDRRPHPLIRQCAAGLEFGDLGTHFGDLGAVLLPITLGVSGQALIPAGQPGDLGVVDPRRRRVGEL